MTPQLTTAQEKNMYATTTVNIRQLPLINSKVVGKVYWNNKIKVIRKINNEWVMVRYKGRYCYISSKYLRNKKYKYKQYISPSDNEFKSYEDADCITNNKKIPQGLLKEKYTLSNNGVWMVGDRYCIAVGSYYTKKIGVKIDLVLSDNNKIKTLKCITADSKADKDTVSNHRIHKDGSVVEFVVNTSSLSKKARLMGDVSYTDKIFKGCIKKIRVYNGG